MVVLIGSWRFSRRGASFGRRVLGERVMNVSSASTILPRPPIGPVPLLSAIASLIWCIRNQAVFMLPPSVRCIWRVEMPFLLLQIR